MKFKSHRNESKLANVTQTRALCLYAATDSRGK
jgi:hypothetical protein